MQKYPFNQFSYRNEGIDAFRFIAFCSVVFLHSISGYSTDINYSNILSYFLRFAVPFFFIASGYFLASKKGTTIEIITGLFYRLFPPFVFWLLIYIAAFPETTRLDDISYWLWCFLTGGPGIHLWFLPALGIGSAILIILRPFGLYLIGAVVIILYLLGLALGAYHEILNISPLSVGVRNGPFFSCLFVFIGYILCKLEVKCSMKQALLFVIIGLLIQLSEAYFLHLMNKPFAPYDYLMGTILLGIGSFSLAQSWKKPACKWISPLGKYVLGMYCIHMMFLLPIRNYIGNSLLENIFLSVTVITLSALSVLIISKLLPFSRKIIM